MTDKELEQIREFIKETRKETRAECFKVLGESVGLDLGNHEDVRRLADVVRFGGKQLDMSEKITNQAIKVTVGVVVISGLGYIGSLIYHNLFRGV
jgi:hypothetical protein